MGTPLQGLFNPQFSTKKEDRQGREGGAERGGGRGGDKKRENALFIPLLLQSEGARSVMGDPVSRGCAKEPICVHKRADERCLGLPQRKSTLYFFNQKKPREIKALRRLRFARPERVRVLQTADRAGVVGLGASGPGRATRAHAGWVCMSPQVAPAVPAAD